jgi:pSer/pThr/pTyr-binding forkhead associated (FHA) protein
VPPQIEVISGVRSWRFELAAQRSTIGKGAENDVSLTDDATASHLHAVLERFAAGWCVTDLGSSNGTWVNGERIWATGPLQRCRSADRDRAPAAPPHPARARRPRGPVPAVGRA